MFRRRLLYNKETLLVIAIVVAVLLLVVLNIFTLFPAVGEILTKSNPADSESPIDIEAVNQAIEYLLGE